MSDPLVPESREVERQPYLDVMHSAARELAALTATPVLMIEPLPREDALERIWLEGGPDSLWLLPEPRRYVSPPRSGCRLDLAKMRRQLARTGYVSPCRDQAPPHRFWPDRRPVCERPAGHEGVHGEGDKSWPRDLPGR